MSGRFLRNGGNGVALRHAGFFFSTPLRVQQNTHEAVYIVSDLLWLLFVLLYLRENVFVPTPVVVVLMCTEGLMRLTDVCVLRCSARSPMGILMLVFL